MASTDDTTLVIKCPSRHAHFTMPFRLDATVADLQERLSEVYEGKPQPADQTLIYAGKVLKDPTVRLRDLVSKHDSLEGPHSIHLVVKQRSSGIASAGSSASPSRSTSFPATGTHTSTATASSAAPSPARPIPPPTRTAERAATAPAAPAPPPAAAPSQPATASTASHPQPDAFHASNPWLSAWPGMGMAAAGLHAAAPPSSTAPGAHASCPTPAVGVAPPGTVGMPYSYYNPVVGAAYHAAYSAALSALAVGDPQPQQPQEQAAATSREGSGVGVGADAGGAGSAAAAAASTSAPAAGEAATAEGGVAMVPMFVPAYGPPYFPPGYPLPVPHAPFPSAYPPLDPLAAGRRPADGAHVDPYGAQLPPYPYPYNGQLLALLGPGGLAAAADRAALAGGLEDAQVHILRHLLGAGQEGRQGEQAGTGLRQRRVLVLGDPQALRNRGAAGGGAAAGAGAAAAAAPAAPAAGGAARRPRVFTIRINMRALLQVLVFGVVLYQHFTWERFLALVIGGLVLWVTTWAPFRRLLRGIHAIPQQQQQQQQLPGAAAGGAGAAAADGQGGAGGQQQQAAQQQRPARRGILTEVLVFVVGFITSLLPAWNFNADDAAAFAVAQEVVAQEERQGQGQQGAEAGAEAEAGQRQGDGAGAEGAEGAAQGGEGQVAEAGEAAAAAL